MDARLVFGVALLIISIASTTIPTASAGRAGEIVLNPTHALPGTLVTFEGVGWNLQPVVTYMGSVERTTCIVSGEPVKVDMYALCEVKNRGGAHEPVGSFRVANVPPGTYSISVSATERPNIWTVEQEFTVDGATAKPASALMLVDLSLSPGAGEHIYVGDTVTDTFTLQNTGTATASNVEVRADLPPEVTVLKITAARDLAPGSSGTWEMTMRPNEAGKFDVVVGFFINGAQQSFQGILKGDSVRITLTVEAKPAFLILERVETAPSASELFYVGDVATITFVATNGGQTSARNVEVKVVDAPSEIEVVQVTPPKSLQPSATDEWQVKIKAAKPGSYEIYASFYINGEKQIFETEGETGTIEQFKVTVAASERPFLETYGLYVIAGLVAIVVIVALVVAMRRRGHAAHAPRPTTTPPPAEGEFCGNCGARMAAGIVFCPNCGARKS